MGAPNLRSIDYTKEVMSVILRATIYSVPQIQKSGAVFPDKHKAHIYIEITITYAGY